MNKMFRISMFITSFIPLWINIIIIDLLSIIKNKNNTIIEFISIIFILISNLIAIIYLMYANFCIDKDYNNKQYKIISAKPEKSITAGFLLSYTLPLFIFDFTSWLGILQFSIYFTTLSFLCIRNDYVYVNIILEILGYKFFECEVSNSNQFNKIITIISNTNIAANINNHINVYELDRPFYLHKIKYNK